MYMYMYIYIYIYICILQPLKANPFETHLFDRHLRTESARGWPTANVGDGTVKERCVGGVSNKYVSFVSCSCKLKEF